MILRRETDRRAARLPSGAIRAILGRICYDNANSTVRAARPSVYPGSGLHGNDNKQTPSPVLTDAAGESADGGPFPAMAQDLLNRTQNRGTVVKPDMHGLLIPDSDGWLIVVKRDKKPGGFYVIPKDTYFQPDVFAVGYKEYFNNNRDAPGNVNVIKPASAVKAGKGWQVVSRGELETT